MRGPAPAWKSGEIWGPAPAWKSGEKMRGPAPAWKSGEIVSATVPPEKEPTRDESGESQQQDEANRDAGGQRHHIAEQGERDHRQHDADHDPLAQGQPGRPTRGQSEPENKTAGDER